MPGSKRVADESDLTKGSKKKFRITELASQDEMKIARLEEHVKELYTWIESSGLALEVPRSIRDQMDKRPEAAKALERAIETVLQKIKRESNVSILRRDASAMGLNYSPRLLPLFPEIARLTRLPGGESCALSLILKFAEFACLDLSEPNFSLKHLQDGYFWIDLDKAALQALLKTSSVDWRIMGHAGIQDALKDFDIFRKKVWESSLSLEDQKMNPVFVWTTNFLKEKSERATKGIF